MNTIRSQITRDGRNPTGGPGIHSTRPGMKLHLSRYVASSFEVTVARIHADHEDRKNRERSTQDHFMWEPLSCGDRSLHLLQAPTRSRRDGALPHKFSGTKPPCAVSHLHTTKRNRMKLVRLLLALSLFVPLLSSAKTVAVPPPPGELVLREINYTATLSDAEARFVADVDLESLNRSEASMPLLDGEVAVLTTKLPDGLRIVRDGNVYRLVASKQARFKFKLEFVSKITRAEPWNQTAFVGPAAAIASVKAQASGDGMEVQLLTGTVRETAQTNGLARVSGFLGPDRAVSLRWQSKAAEAAHKAVVT